MKYHISDTNYFNILVNRKFMFVIVILAIFILPIAVKVDGYAKNKTAEAFLEITDNKYNFSGTGTKEDPFLISSLDKLKLLRDNVDYGVTYDGYYFAQTDDLFFSKDENWNPIGDLKKGYAFEGHYDGCGYTINSIYCIDSYAGLFSLLGGEVRNLGIESGCFQGDYIGSITSHGTGNTRIINCYNKASVIGTCRAGGITDNYPGQILFCWSLGEVAGESAETITAGISSCGAASIEYCYTTESENLVDISTYTGKITESFHIECHGINNILSDIYTKMGEFKDSALISYKNLTFPIFDSGNLTFSKEIVPLKYILVLIKGFYVEIFLAFVSVLFLIPFLMKFNKNRTVMQEISLPPKKEKYSLVQNKQLDLSETQKWNADEQRYLKKIARNRFIAIITTIVLLIAGFSTAFNILKLEYASGVLNLEFYGKPENAGADILLLGGSSMSVNIEVAELWKEAGISAYCLGGGNATMCDNYYRLIEAQKQHRVKMVVVEVRTVSFSSTYSDDVTKMWNVTGLPLSFNKLKYINAAVEPDARLNYILDFPLYHNRFHSLSKWDFLHNSILGDNDKGTWAIFYGNQYAPELTQASEVTEYRAINEKHEYYLQKIIEYCNKNTLPLLLIKTPDANREKNQPFYNTVGLLAEKYNIPFLDFNQHDEEIGLLPSDFYNDANHLNVAGARKCTQYLANYLKENYDFADHRGDKEYQSWDLFTNNRENLYLKAITDNTDYFAELTRDAREITVIPYKLLKEKPDVLLGVETALSDLSHDIAVSDDTVDENGRKEIISLGSNRVEIEKNYSSCIVSINNENVASIASPGYLVIIYDKTTDEIVDVTGFTAENNFALKHFGFSEFQEIMSKYNGIVL